MNTKEKKKHLGLWISLGILAVLLIVGMIFCYFGGFGTGESADREEFSKYAEGISEIKIPENTSIIALGEATHGCADFQQLKSDVFQNMVEKYGVRAFALEADYGCCETANLYIHGGAGTAEEAADALGFQIYKTPEMAALLSWMRSYNEKAPSGQDLRFYGFDMQRYEASYGYLIEGAKKAGIDTRELENAWDGREYKEEVTSEQRAEIINKVKDALLQKNSAETARTVHFADSLLQNIQLGQCTDMNVELSALRDRLMAENTLWILEQEQARGHQRILISGHNGHIEQFGSYGDSGKVMGNLLADELGEGYFAIGTDFYKAQVNIPKGNGKRTVLTVFSRDPLAKAAKKCGFDRCWLDFSKIPQDSVLSQTVNDYIWMGSLGEVTDSALLHLLPMTYRVWRCPAKCYDGMIFVSDAQPTEIRE